MSGKAKTVAALVLGSLIGGVLSFFVMGYQTRKIMAIYAEAALFGAAIDARQLAAGQSHAVLQRKNDAMPNLALRFEREHARYLPQNQRVAALWEVQRCYSENPSPGLPSEVKAILDGLPARPPTRCELKDLTVPRQDP